MKKAKAYRYLGLIAALAVLVAAVPSEARIRHRHHDDPRRDYTQRGFQLYFGIGGQGYEIQDEDYEFLEEQDSEGLFFVGAAIGVDRGLSLYLEGAGSEHDTPLGDMTFGYVQVGLKYAPNTGYRHLWQPYGKFSFGGVVLVDEDGRYDPGIPGCHDDDETTFAGPAISLGAGVDRFISRRTALFAEVGLMFGEFDHIVVDDEDYDLADDIGINSGRLLFGIRFRL